MNSVIYFLVSLFLYILFLPFLVIHILFNIKNRKLSLASSFFLYKNPSFTQNDIWFHSSSLGETKSTKSIIDKLETNVNISVSTKAGFDEALKQTSFVRFLPYEIFLPFWIKKHKVLVVVEAEFWYFLFLFAKRKGAKIILVNARIKQNNFKKYFFFRFYFKKVLSQIDYIFTQGENDKKLLTILGAKNIQATGNIKANIDIKITKNYKKLYSTIIIGASTHNQEEEILLKAFANVDIKNKQLLIAPRHDYRFAKLDKQISNFAKENDYSYSKFSQNNNIYSDIVLIDTIGELNNLYALADIVVLGGSFVKEDNIGGHNPLEPAFFNCKIITGAYIAEQKYTFSLISDFIICKETVFLYQDIKNAYNNHKKTTIINKPNIQPIVEKIKRYQNEK